MTPHSKIRYFCLFSETVIYPLNKVYATLQFCVAEARSYQPGMPKTAKSRQCQIQLPNKMKNHSGWMGQLLHADSPVAKKPINNIIIPGTHDSGTYGMGTLSATQSLSIQEQLDYGVRYLDCRIRLVGDDYMFYHYYTSPNKFGTRHGVPSVNTDCVLYDIYTFLVNNPNEILILKFQDFNDFTADDDYIDFLRLIRNYVEFSATGAQKSASKVVTLDEGTTEYIYKESIKSLNDKGMRVFLFFDVKNVPAKPAVAKGIWDFAFQYSPVLTKGSYGLWDPYWNDGGANISVKDTCQADFDAFWAWHEKNRAVWLKKPEKAGFYVLQSHMQQLGSAVGYENFYYDLAEQGADGNYYMNQDPSTGDYLSNNVSNIHHYLAMAKLANPETFNIILFDFIQDGDVCGAVMDYYFNPAPAVPQAITYKKNITLKLNGLTRYISYGEESKGYLYPVLRGDAVALYIVHATKESDEGIIKDGDEIMICTTESTDNKWNQLSVYKTKELYYYYGNQLAERWTIRNGRRGSEIKTGDFVTFESKSYDDQFLTFTGKFLTTDKMNLPTRWIINA